MTEGGRWWVGMTVGGLWLVGVSAGSRNLMMSSIGGGSTAAARGREGRSVVTAERGIA